MPDTLHDGTAHPLPDDLRAALTADVAAVARWQSLTLLGRNEFITEPLTPNNPSPARGTSCGRRRNCTKANAGLAAGQERAPGGQSVERVAAGEGG
ncbi:YdeI/OmpD-associated family protein [Sphingomonas sp. SUN039]|uniref:YdeI/OmpD-associated family protein n=1 Tax=Sphingomonas sp. SUN039 TaxID=2937787 RepID=UPI0021640341|nr:YdeI/OmpD-associated family protein [Sphingomonas sp. SUN039]UVO55211.1 YdeI/OmpD-associated family protein [Sphingomonas sp. SUN039]